MRKSYLLIAFLGVCGELWAQGISLVQYREQVMEYNQDIKKSKEAVS